MVYRNVSGPSVKFTQGSTPTFQHNFSLWVVSRFSGKGPRHLTKFCCFHLLGVVLSFLSPPILENLRSLSGH